MARSENRIEVCLGHFGAKHKDNQLALHHRLWNTSEDISEQIVPAYKLYAHEMKTVVKGLLHCENKLSLGDSAIIFTYLCLEKRRVLVD